MEENGIPVCVLSGYPAVRKNKDVQKGEYFNDTKINSGR